jgi:ElaB/YqjD/DUF883 family membrane-anchored ribosome-binding protein
MAKTITNSEQIEAALEKLKKASSAKELELLELVTAVYEVVKERQEVAVEKVKNVASAVDESVRQKPWHYIGGAALAGLLIGLFSRR